MRLVPGQQHPQLVGTDRFRRDIDRQVRIGRNPRQMAERDTRRRQFKLGTHPQAGRLLEPAAGRHVVLDRKTRKRFVSHDMAVSQAHDGLQRRRQLRALQHRFQPRTTFHGLLALAIALPLPVLERRAHLRVLDRLVEAGGHQRAELVERALLCVAIGAGQRRHHLEHADRLPPEVQRRDQHRTQPDVAAGVAIDARIGLAVIAAHDAAFFQAASGQAALHRQRQADLVARDAARRPVAHVLAIADLQHRTSRSRQFLCAIGDRIDDVLRIRSGGGDFALRGHDPRQQRDRILVGHRRYRWACRRERNQFVVASHLRRSLRMMMGCACLRASRWDRC